MKTSNKILLAGLALVIVSAIIGMVVTRNNMQVIKKSDIEVNKSEVKDSSTIKGNIEG